MVNLPVEVVAIIQVRLGSERLPRKALLPLPFSGGVALIEHVIKRARAAAKVDKVVIATTNLTSDEPIVTFCKENNIVCFRGSPDNVLDRFVQAGKQYQADIVVRLTGDNPFIQPSYIDDAIQKHIDNKVDYTITEGLPLGTNIEVVSFKALQSALDSTEETSDIEHVTPYIRRKQEFQKQTLTIKSELSQLRLTVDYPSDYALASMLYERLYKTDSIFDLEAVCELIAEQPWLSLINNHHLQKKVLNSEAEELDEAVRLLKEKGLIRAIDRLIRET